MSQSSFSSIVRGVAAMDVSQDDVKPKATKAFVPSHKSTHSPNGQTTISRQNSMTKLRTKYAKPHPFQLASSSQSNAVRLALESQAQAQQPACPPSPSKEAKAAANTFDIGSYDGWFEAETTEGRGQVVYGESAKELALDSSHASVSIYSSSCITQAFG